MAPDATTGEVRVAGACLRFSVAGPEGAPWVTLLHSLATDRRLWAAQAERLADRFRVLSLDLRGHGLSDTDDRPALMSDLVDDVVAVWDALGVKHSHVVGLSIGGMTALGLGLDHALRVGRIVAADCRADAPDFFREMWVARRAMVRAGGLDAVTEATLGSWLTPTTRNQHPEVESLVRGMIAATSVQGYMAATHALMHLDYKQHLARMTRPVLFICGAEDGLHPAEMRLMADLTPGSAFHEIAGASHLSNLEQPAAFDGAVGEWLDAPPPRPQP